MSALRNVATMAVLLTLLVGAAADRGSAQTVDDTCGFDENGDWVCVGSGGGGSDDDPPTTYWTAWTATGYCLTPGGEAILWDRYQRRTSDNSIVDTETTCVEPDWGVIWDDISEVAAALGVPQFETAPPSSFGAVVGSPMLLWYTGQTQIPPITATITDPTGIVYGVEGRAWIEQITWNMGDGSSASSSYRGSFAESVSFGSFDSPEAEYTYQLTSSSQGYPIDPNRCDLAFTPVSVTLTWTGEYRAVEGVLQTSWNRVPGNLGVTETFEIPVREIRSSLDSDDADPSDDECVWTNGQG